MSPTPPTPLNPSQAVERIREIIVGRHLDKLEARVARLESAAVRGSVPASWEDRLCTSEARLEALQQSLQRLAESSREDIEQHTRQQQAEIQRLAAQIQQVAALKAAESAQPAVDRLEQKLGTWLSNWQGALQSHLNEREQRMAAELRQEVAALWENTESQITRLQSRAIELDRVDERFRRIAAAARALAECAMPSSSGPEHATP
jgi:chromosome segregation ATPase